MVLDLNGWTPQDAPARKRPRQPGLPPGCRRMPAQVAVRVPDHLALGTVDIAALQAVDADPSAVLAAWRIALRQWCADQDCSAADLRRGDQWPDEEDVPAAAVVVEAGRTAAGG
jgi:hypothetical protein